MDASKILNADDKEIVTRFPKADQQELDRLKRLLRPNPALATQFADEYRHRREYNHFVFEMMTKHGDSVQNEFNFKSEEAVKYAQELIGKLAPVDTD